MSTPSMLLLCAAAASSLAGVWALAGLSETSRLKSAPRVLGAAAVGLCVEGALYLRAPSALRAELSLPLLFGIASVLALTVGAAKVEGALADKDGPRVVRRAAGIVAGTFFGMAAIGAASLDLCARALVEPRVGWALMFGPVLATLLVFAQRARYAGLGLLNLGRRAYVLVLVAGALLTGAGLSSSECEGRPVSARQVVDARSRAAVPAPSVAELPSAAAVPSAAVAPSASTAALASAAPAAPSASASPVPASAPSAAASAPSGHPGELQIEAVTARGMLEADARGGVQRRNERLQACLADPKNQQTGTLTLRIGIDPSGSVAYSRA
ncbi:MAG TPA: hypothetical protein VNG33_14865, partial [Polyangiaceae bacterium]|nr:hypothetical protein [Polyangiaceae bacterium]